MWSSVDSYRTVCADERIYLTCAAASSWSLTWTSEHYIGRQTAIEYNQDIDRPGEGKFVRLQSGEATLSQVVGTDPALMSDLRIQVASNLDRTEVTCTNDRGGRQTKVFLLAQGMCM